MKARFYFLSLVTASLFTMGAPAQAADDVLYLSIDNALSQPKAQEVLNPDIPLHFAGQPKIAYSQKLGTFVSNKKTNAALKSDETACNWVILSALISLQERAVNEGGKAVVDIESFYDQQPYQSATEFECRAGAIMAGVALRGTVVK